MHEKTNKMLFFFQLSSTETGLYRHKGLLEAGILDLGRRGIVLSL